MRTFLALCFPVGMTRRIAETMDQKGAQLRDLGWKLAWVPPANLHVTLKFFGSIPPESLDAIAMRLRQRLIEVPQVTLRARGQGVFPHPSEGPPRILWIGVDGGKALTSLHRLVEDEMADLGFAKEARPFHPHLTVARVLEPPSELSAWPTDDQVDFGEEPIPELVVYESQIQKSTKPNRAGQEYLARARVPFSK